MAIKKRRLVIKVGSSTVADDRGRLDHESIKMLVAQIAGAIGSGAECVLVTSGAIAAGVECLGLKDRPKSIAKQQAAAAIGQGLLIHEYSGHFKTHALVVAQVLLTQFDMAHRELYLNARQAIDEILSMGAIPIVNENDTTAVAEIKFGDNDTIAALVAVLLQADTLIILSDIEGLHTGDPRGGGETTLVSRVSEITDEVAALGSAKGGRLGSGGMATKIDAARIVGAAGIGMYIADGRESRVLDKIIGGETVGTYFVPKKDKVSGRKLWIGFGSNVRGHIVIDDGAVEAIIKDGRSLLPAGVIGHSGEFSIGDTVEVRASDGRAIARGSTNYTAREMSGIKGKKTKEIAELMMGENSEEVIHRDFMVIL